MVMRSFFSPLLGATSHPAPIMAQISITIIILFLISTFCIVGFSPPQIPVYRADTNEVYHHRKRLSSPISRVSPRPAGRRASVSLRTLTAFFNVSADIAGIISMSLRTYNFCSFVNNYKLFLYVSMDIQLFYFFEKFQSHFSER